MSDSPEAPADAQNRDEPAAGESGDRTRVRALRRRRSPLRGRIVIGAVLGALLVAMIWNTKFLTPEELEALTPEEFDAETTAQQLYDQAQEELTEDPDELGPVAESLAEDPDAAAEEFDAYVPSEGTNAFSVTVTGVVEEVTEEALTVDVGAVETGQSTTIPLGNAVDGELVRDLVGFQFGDAPGQTEYQQVGNELSALMRAGAQESFGSDAASLEGEEITVNGILTYTGTDPDAAAERPLIIQPLTVGAGE